MWLATVFGAIDIFLAISALRAPAAMRPSTSRSLLVRPGKRIAGSGWGGDQAEHPAGDTGPEDGLARGDGLDRADDLLLLGALEHVAARPGTHRRGAGHPARAALCGNSSMFVGIDKLMSGLKH